MRHSDTPAAPSDTQVDVHRPYTRAAVAMASRQNDAQEREAHGIPLPGDLPARTTTSLTYLRQRRLMRLSGSRRASHDLEPAKDVYLAPSTDFTSAVATGYNAVRVGMADDDAAPSTRRLTAARRLTGSSLAQPKTYIPPYSDDANPSDVGLSSGEHTSGDRLQTLAQQSAAATSSAPRDLPAAPRTGSSRSSRQDSVSDSETFLEAANGTFVAFRASRDAVSSRYTSVESSSSDEEAQGSPTKAASANAESPHSLTESPHSLARTGSRSYLPSSSSDASSVYDGSTSQPHSPQSVLHGAAALRLLSAFGRSSTLRSAKPAYSRQVRIAQRIITPITLH